MPSYRVTFPNEQTIELPDRARAAIAESKAKYIIPQWLHREEEVLKLSGRQWIFPESVATARELVALYPHGIIATAWKLFNRGWVGAAEKYTVDTRFFPDHPRHFGSGVVPLVDEDHQSKQIGWVRINQQTRMDDNFAIFVQFTILDLFDPRDLPEGY